MHELSIASALLDLALSHLPAGAQLRSVKIQAGPMRAIDPQALDWAWSASLTERKLPAVKMDFDQLPWTLHCPSCHKQWSSADLCDICPCGSPAHPKGGDELRLISIEVSD